MRKILTTTFVTLDGVMQAPGGAEEDRSGGFEYGGWQLAYPTDDKTNARLSAIMNAPFELLPGKTTYDIFATYWPTVQTDNEVAIPFNKTRKYVVSHIAFETSWKNSTCITGDVVSQLQKLKHEDGPDLRVWGSGNLIQTLLRHHLIDQMLLWIYPITIGTGKKLLADGIQPENFKLVESEISTTGVIFAAYEPIGPLESRSTVSYK